MKKIAFLGFLFLLNTSFAQSVYRLPIFYLSPSEQGIAIDWAFPCGTAAEYFTVQKTKDFSSVETLQTTRQRAICSTNGGLTTFSAQDTAPYKGLSAYRILIQYQDSINVSAWEQISFGAVEYAAVSVYPNPVNEILQIEWEQAEAENVAITISNLEGKILSSTKLEKLPLGFHSYKLDTHHLAQGLYNCSVQIGSRIFNERVAVGR